ncbi:MAG: polymer-forming cytoskeletal protein [Leptolyngbya sp. SIO3F4]|nr:polymer-forming cytoskeletal protein [Leptolyngbya sp. SIO3F4]
MAKGAEVDSGSRNHIAQGTTITGDIVTDGDLRVDGRVEGTIVSKGKLVVGGSGTVKGDIKCVNANVSGMVQGTMTVNEMIAVQASGKFSGDLSYGKLSVEPGAQLEGMFTIAGKLKELASNERAKEKAKAERTA